MNIESRKVLLKLLLPLFSSSALGIAPMDHSVGNKSEALSVRPSSSKGPCSLASLKGTYIYSASGSLESGAVSYRQSGIETYDGKGNVRFKATQSIIPGSVKSFFPASATYIINPDCTGQLLSQNVPYEDIFVSPDGSFFTHISIEEGAQVNGEVNRITKKIININP